MPFRPPLWKTMCFSSPSVPWIKTFALEGDANPDRERPARRIYPHVNIAELVADVARCPGEVPRGQLRIHARRARERKQVRRLLVPPPSEQHSYHANRHGS